MDKKQVQEAIARVDSAVGQLAVTRVVHIALVNDVQLIQKCCEQQFEEPKDGGTNIIPIHTEPGGEDQQGGGDSV